MRRKCNQIIVNGHTFSAHTSLEFDSAVSSTVGVQLTMVVIKIMSPRYANSFEKYARPQMLAIVRNRFPVMAAGSYSSLTLYFILF